MCVISRAAVLTVSPPNPEDEAAPLLPAAAEALFEAARCLSAADDAPVAILDAAARVVHAGAAAERLLDANSRSAVRARLASGEGPTARRLRRLAAAAPLAEPRLEQVRFALGRRPVALNLRCTRLADRGATYLVLSAPNQARPAELPADAPTAEAALSAPAAVRRPRFLWTLDADGAFGPADPALAAALGANAPRPGESVAELMRRVDMTNGEDLAAALARRKTFAGLSLLWPASEPGRRARIALSGSPVFDRARAFMGYRGFGLLGETVAAASETPSPPEAAEAGGFAEEAPAQALFSDRDASRAKFPFAAPGGAGDGPTFAPPAASPERTAEIYVLRQIAPSAGKVVPIRPGALEAAPADPGRPGGESVELSRAEREAFREIARALIGRGPPRDDRSAEPRLKRSPAFASAEALSASPPHLEETPDAADWRAAALSRNAAAVLDRLPLGVIVVRDARALYANQTLLSLIGYRDFAQFEGAGGLAAMFRGRDSNGFAPDERGAFAIVGSDGRLVAVDGRAQAIAWDDAPATLIALRRAPDGARRAGGESQAEARQGLAAELREMLDHAADGAATLDLAGRIQSLNRPAERLFGYLEAEVLGESLLMLLTPQSHPDATARLEIISQSDHGAGSRPIAVAGRTRDGEALELGLTLARIGPPEAPQFCALFRNLAPEREAERRLVAARDAALAASAAKTDFLAHVSHEIRTPLNAIVGFAEVMMEERFGPIGNARYQDYLKDIHASARHVASLADDLLDLSKIETGKLELAFAPVDANSVIRECVSLMAPQAARERIIMRISLFDPLPRVFADERSLRQIMLNLMSNAVKFNAPGGQVIVSTALDTAGQAVIRVRDTGVGMNESEVGVALEPFGRIGAAGSKAGVGLGLPLTKALVEANRAEFSIKSRREQGTLIEIAFPVIQAAQ